MRSIPIVTKNLLIINVLVFAASYVFPWLNSVGGLHFFLASDFHLYQFVTYMFLHSGFSHIFFNMFALWMFGCVLENVWGPKKFLFYYLSCGVGAGIMQELAQFMSFYITVSSSNPGISIADALFVSDGVANALNGWTTIGASGGVYAILLAFGMTFPNERIFIFPLPIPIKAKWFVMFYVVIELFSALGSAGDGVAHMAHLGGMLFGFLMIRYWNKHPDARYDRESGSRFFDNLKRNFDRRSNKGGAGSTNSRWGGSGTTTGRESDWEYNARKKANQEEVDRILDKIRASGYDSLTKEEKKKLFESSNND